MNSLTSSQRLKFSKEEDFKLIQLVGESGLKS
jgi:hypothetical protein